MRLDLKKFIRKRELKKYCLGGNKWIQMTIRLKPFSYKIIYCLTSMFFVKPLS